MRINQILIALCVAILAPQMLHGSAQQRKKKSGNNQQQAELVPATTAQTTQIAVPVEPIIPPTNTPIALPPETKEEEHHSSRRFVKESDSPTQLRPQTPPQARSPRLPVTDVHAALTTHLTVTEIQRLSALTHEEAQEWDDANPEGPTSTRPKPGSPNFWARIAAVPTAWWEKHVSDQYRVERLRIFCGLTTTYALLLEKIQSEEYRGFIEDLNKEHGEGTRWIDAALQETVDAQLESPTRRILSRSADFIPGLPIKTRTKLCTYLSLLSDKKRTALQEELTGFSTDQENLANLVRQVNTEPIQTLPESSHTEFASKTALAATRFGSYSLFPSAVK